MDSASLPNLSDPPERNLTATEAHDETRVAGIAGKGTEKVNQSWVSAAKDRECLKKYEVEISMKEGKHMVEIPDDVISDSTPLWEDFVVGKFLDLAPHVAKVHMVLNKIWKYGDESTTVEVYEVNATTMRFRVSSSKAREKILRRGMWNIAGVPMVVANWSPKTEEEKQEEEAIPVWVYVRKVPLHMFSWERLSLITSPVGFPVRLHPEMVACSNFDEAKVFVNVDVSKALPKEISFTKNGKEFTAEFHYPWLPSRCNVCDKWGHVESVCVMKSKEKKKKEVSIGNSEAKQDDICEVESEKKELGTGRSGERVENNDTEEHGNIRNVIVGGQGSKSWSLVSPAKIRRSTASTSKGSDEIQISSSKFSVLCDEAEEGEIVGDGQHRDEEETGRSRRSG